MKTNEKKSRKKGIRARKTEIPWPFSKENYRLFAIGILILIVGYIFLAQGPWDSFWSRTLAPILLVIGYTIILPASLLYKKKQNGNSKKA